MVIKINQLYQRGMDEKILYNSVEVFGGHLKKE